MGLRDSIKSDANSIFLNTSEFAEVVTYSFRAGGTRSVSALIDREPPAIYRNNGEVVSAKYLIKLHCNTSSGVLSSEVDTGGDQVTLLKEFGGVVTETVSVVVKLSEDMGMIELALI